MPVSHAECGGAPVPGQREGEVCDAAVLDAATARFIAAQPFFILGTASDGGDADCSYRGRAHRPDGSAEALLHVVDASTLVFPDYAGNNLFNSIGNLLRNGCVSLLFVDFEHGRGARINGRAHVDPDATAAWASTWPRARSIITVAISDAAVKGREDLPRLRPAALAPGMHR